MRLDFSGAPAKAFKQVWIIHGLMAGGVLVCAVAGETVIRVDPEFERRGGYTAFGDVAWAVRAAALLFLVQMALLLLLTPERWVLRKVMELRPQNIDLAVTRTLTSVQVVRSAQGPVVATFGVLLFFGSADRSDIYVSAVFALNLLFFWHPTRSQWESFFHRAATQYEGVSARPW